MGGLSPLHWIIIIGALLLLLGGGGKISGLMGDAAKGIKAFRDGMKDEPEKPVEPTVLSAPASADAPVTKREDAKS
ncbi:MAG: twin-arginine translocase TatA/TatE family subunit [Pseudomonadota bacterium]|nr:twin-arginine translocase TatA/TatE family subunit [Pseudomonadota bacterium]